MIHYVKLRKAFFLLSFFIELLALIICVNCQINILNLKNNWSWNENDTKNSTERNEMLHRGRWCWFRIAQFWNTLLVCFTGLLLLSFLSFPSCSPSRLLLHKKNKYRYLNSLWFWEIIVKMTSSLDQLKKFTVVVADTGEFDGNFLLYFVVLLLINYVIIETFITWLLQDTYSCTHIWTSILFLVKI